MSCRHHRPLPFHLSSAPSRSGSSGSRGIWLLSGVVGLAVRGSASLVLTSISFVLLGGLVVSDARLPLGTTTVLAALLGLVHGYLNGATMAQPGLGTLGLVGIVSGLFAQP